MNEEKMTAEENWKSSIEANVQKALAEVGKANKRLTEINDMREQLERFADNTKAELEANTRVALDEAIANLQLNAGTVIRPAPPPAVFFQKPPKYKEGEDPETFINFYELLAKGNRWDDQEMAERLPTYFPLSLLSWYLQLDEGVKRSFGRLKKAFVGRFDLTRDRQQLLIDYHDLRARNFVSLDAYASRVQDIGLKLGKSPDENLLQFKLGLPVPTFKWIQERKPKTIEQALRLAIDFIAMFGGSAKAAMALLPEVEQAPERYEEPMEHKMKTSGANKAAYPQKSRVYNSREFGNGERANWRNAGSSGQAKTNVNANSARNDGSFFRGTSGRPNSRPTGGAERYPRVNNYAMEGETSEREGDGRGNLQDDVEFTAEWFRGLSGNDNNPTAPTQ